MHEEDFEAAADAFEQAYSLNPICYRAHYNRVLCLLDVMKQDAAFETFQIQDSFGGVMYEKYYKMTMLYSDKREFTKAYRKFATATSMHFAGNVEVRTQLEDILESLGVVDRSYMSWERINETSQWLVKLIDKGHFRNPMKF